MRLIPAFLLLIGGTACGCMAAMSYKKRVDALLACELLLERMGSLLSLENMPTEVLFQRLSAMAELRTLAFVEKTAKGLQESCDFPAVFRAALEEGGAAGLNEADRAILLRLSGLIGAYELERQLAGIEAVKELIVLQRHQASEIQHRDGKMVRSLGVLGGIAAAIITI